MKKLLIAAFLALPIMGMAQTTLTPQEQLEQAQKQLQEAQAALEKAKENAAKAAEAKQKAEAEAKEKAEAAAKAKADAEAKAQAEALQKQIKEAREETARLNAEAEKLNQEAKAAPAEPQTAVETPVTTQPSAQTWSQPATTVLTQPTDKSEKSSDLSKYVAEGTVPEVDGLVEWSTEIAAPGLSAAQVYSKLCTALTQYTQNDNQIEGSKVALADENEHSMLVTVREWLTFSNSFLSLDRADCSYVLQVQCHDGGATVKMNHIKYVYTTQTTTEHFTAEEWITDKMAVNKKRTKLYRITGKFRRSTIDRKDAVFKYLADSIKLL